MEVSVGCRQDRTFPTVSSNQPLVASPKREFMEALADSPSSLASQGWDGFKPGNELQKNYGFLLTPFPVRRVPPPPP